MLQWPLQSAIALFALAAPGIAAARNALLLAEPVSARLLGENDEPADHPTAVNTDAWFQVRFRVVRVMAGAYREREISLRLRAHERQQLLASRRWSILLADTPQGEQWEARPLTRLVCVSNDVQHSTAFLRDHRWLDVAARGSGAQVLGDVACLALHEYADELD